VIADDFGWSAAKATAINIWATIGVFVVSLMVGTLLDRFGRKKTLILLVIGGAVRAASESGRGGSYCTDAGRFAGRRSVPWPDPWAQQW
jgi:MFS family permease